MIMSKPNRYEIEQDITHSGAWPLLRYLSVFSERLDVLSCLYQFTPRLANERDVYERMGLDWLNILGAINGSLKSVYA